MSDWATTTPTRGPGAPPATRTAPSATTAREHRLRRWPARSAAAPPALTSAAYATDFKEVKALGAKASARRTAAQTETALFISGIPFAPLQEALRDLTIRRGMDISDRARLFAAVDVSIADAVSVSWDSKFHYGFWRPITAIHQAAADGNPATEADPTWEPLLVDPPLPRLHQRPLLGRRLRHPRPDPRPRHRPHRPVPHLLGDQHHPPLRVRRRPLPGRGERPRLVGPPLPHGGRRRARPGGRRSPTGRSTTYFRPRATA